MGGWDPQHGQDGQTGWTGWTDRKCGFENTFWPAPVHKCVKPLFVIIMIGRLFVPVFCQHLHINPIHSPEHQGNHSDTILVQGTLGPSNRLPKRMPKLSLVFGSIFDALLMNVDLENGAQMHQKSIQKQD